MAPADLAERNGTKPDSLLLLLALRCSASRHSALILDVSEGDEYYGPGGPYHCLTGRDASRAFSLTSLKPEHLHAEMSSATDEEWKVLDDWFNKLSAKYPSVGFVLPQKEPESSKPEQAAGAVEENKEAKRRRSHRRRRSQTMLTRMSGGTWMMEIRMLSFSSFMSIDCTHLHRKNIVHPRYIARRSRLSPQPLASQRLGRHACMRSTLSPPQK